MSESTLFLSLFSFQSSVFTSRKLGKKEPKQLYTNFVWKSFDKWERKKLLKHFWFTDLTVAGLPAKLKHIIKRRKRKQPWFPQSGATEEESNSLPNRLLNVCELWQKCRGRLSGDWWNYYMQSWQVLDTTSRVNIWPQLGDSPLNQKPCSQKRWQESSTAWECSVKRQVCVCQS